MGIHDLNRDEGEAGGRFATTRWSIVLAAGRNSAGSGRALQDLCRIYWYPLYAYARRRGYAVQEAEDLVQEFFAELLEKATVQRADPTRGRFRSFLLTVFTRFLNRQRQRGAAQKRGGGRPAVSIDCTAGEARYRQEPRDDLTPEKVFQRRWALTVLQQALARLEDHYAARGALPVFEKLRPYLVADQLGPPYAQLAPDLDMSAGALKVAVHRLRRRYRQLLREEVAETVARQQDVDAELQELLESLRM